MFRRLSACLVLFFALLVGGCGSPQAEPHPQFSRLGAEEQFQGKALELAMAAEHGDVPAIHRLMKREGVNPDGYFTDRGYPLLVWPVIAQQPGSLQAMLEDGADPNAKQLHPDQQSERFRGMYRSNALVFAAQQEDPIYLKLLLDHGGDPNTRNADEENLIFQAYIHQNQWQNVKLLVERGADINAMASVGAPIIESYAGRGGFLQVHWLLEHGADPFAGDPPKVPDFHPVLNAVFWHPGNPNDPTWQRECQQWFLQHGYKRPPMPENFRIMRKNLGFPYEEEDIPLL